MNNVKNDYHSDIPPIPGAYELLSHASSIPTGIFLLTGSPGTGKTMYCRQFIIDGLRRKDACLFLSSSMTEEEFSLLYSGIDQSLSKNVLFLNPFGSAASKKDIALKSLTSIKQIRTFIGKRTVNSEKREQQQSSIRIVVDSLTHMSLVSGERAMLNFARHLFELVRQSGSTAVCTLAASDQHLDKLAIFAQAILEMKIEEKDNRGSLSRGLRLLSIKGVHHEPQWVNFAILDNGDLSFSDQSASLPMLSCTLCGKRIVNEPITESDLVFDTQDCVETYKKLAGAYGIDLVETGLTSRAFNVSFFFVDIVGLSDPALSVKKQIQKIEILNKLISSSDSFRRVGHSKRIILPTGDGMAIGFLLNPELPLELGIELHRKLRQYDRNKSKDDQIHIRVGLASGPVYRVTDMNNVQNVWGPGIILARRVMDAGDSGHILLADRLAEELIALKDEYRSIIKPICLVYEIKHGQKITLYSAYSDEFGNSELPVRVPRIH